MKQRYHLLDAIRGLAIILMISYHFTWDLIYIFGLRSDLLISPFGVFWQSFSAYTFILLSGFCWCLGKHHLRHGLTCFLTGALMTFVTLCIMPENRILFGVLTLLGSCMLLMIFLHKFFDKIPAILGFCVVFFLFIFTRNINAASLGFGEWRIFSVPSWLYQNNITAYLGFPNRGFYSSDYFSIFPWFFLFCSGYFLYKIANRFLSKDTFFWRLLEKKFNPLSFIGRHSLLIYVFHQPIIYGGLTLFFMIF